jgi:high-affinity iron transporter
MFNIFVLTLREGIEAFLIVAITLAYLRQTHRHALTPAAYWGTGCAIALSAIASYFFSKADNKPLWEGLLALVAAVLVISMTIYMWRAAKHMRTHIGLGIEAALANRSQGAGWWGVFAFVLLMITREGMETALVLSTLAMEKGSEALFVGALLGVLGAAALAWAWARYGRRVNLAKFFKVTAIFLLLFSVQLVIYAIHELSEGNALPFLDRAGNEWLHEVSEPYGPEGFWGQMLTWAMVIVPVAYLVWTWLTERKPPVTAA